MPNWLLAAFLFSVYSLRTADACMPGYEVERAKLRQYLGIEWVPEGMDKADAQPTKFVRRSVDLNCDFSHPTECRWQNVKDGEDSLDFHLFRKEDNTPFPVVQVHPGPSQLKLGDQMLFTGDRKREEKDALLVSWPIKCQNSTGLLTFTFWIYNGARVEVLLMEDVKTEDDETELRPLPEKPHIDCGTVTVNTECRVEIPPRDKPFRLGIRAYDMAHPDGAFAMLDNIIYEADFCKVAVDFGPDFKTEPLITAAQGMPIGTASDLACDSFASRCRWRNGGFAGVVPWMRATQKIPETVLFNETGTYSVPKPPFAFMYLEQDQSGGGSKLLVSDPVQCQAPSGSTLTFKIWSSRGIKTSACILDLDMNEKECHVVSSMRAPAPSSHHFEHTKDFMYAIKTEVVSKDGDNFVLIDDIDYEATMCFDAYNALDLGSDFYSTPMLGVIFNRAAHSAKELECDFSRRALDCFWAPLDIASNANSGDAQDPKWEIGVGTIDKRKFQYLSRRNSLPDGEFAVAMFRKGQHGAPAILISETIRCMKSGATLVFRYWHTGDASVSVCVIQSFSDEILDCQNVGEGSAELIEVEIPNYKEPIRLAFKAELPENSPEAEGLVIVDDIRLQAQFCLTAAYSANSARDPQDKSHLHSAYNAPFEQSDTPANEVSSKQTFLSPDSNVCRLLSCNFDLGHMCLYESHRVASGISMFSAYNFSAHTMLFERSRVSMLESTNFNLNAPARLHFDYSVTKGSAQLHVCQDSIRQELDSCYTVLNSDNSPSNSSQLVHDFVEILPSDTKLYIIAKLEKNSRKASVYVDNFQLTNTDNQRLC